MKRKKTASKKPKVFSAAGRACIAAGFNNTLITITDLKGNVVCGGSSGAAGFRGTRKSTPFAAATSAVRVAKKAASLGIKEVSVFVKGPGVGRDAAIKSLRAGGLKVRSITDVTPIPHNGCRPKKRRRV